jgi:hypothetical protein
VPAADRSGDHTLRAGSDILRLRRTCPKGATFCNIAYSVNGKEFGKIDFFGTRPSVAPSPDFERTVWYRRFLLTDGHAGVAAQHTRRNSGGPAYSLPTGGTDDFPCPRGGSGTSIIGAVESVGDALVDGIGLAVDAVTIDLQQDGDAVPRGWSATG